MVQTIFTNTVTRSQIERYTWRHSCNEDWAHHYKVQDGVLFMKEAEGNRLVIPKSRRVHLLRRFHYSSFGEHCGVSKTYSRIRDIAYWPGMFRDVESWVVGCLPCQRRKIPQDKGQGFLQSPIIEAPDHTVSIDILGPFKKWFRWEMSKPKRVLMPSLFSGWSSLQLRPDCWVIVEVNSCRHHSIDCVPGLVSQRFTPPHVILRPTLTLRDSIDSSVPICLCIHNQTRKIGTATFQLVSWRIEQLFMMSLGFLRFPHVWRKTEDSIWNTVDSTSKASWRKLQEHWSKSVIVFSDIKLLVCIISSRRNLITAYKPHHSHKLFLRWTGPHRVLKKQSDLVYDVEHLWTKRV